MDQYPEVPAVVHSRSSLRLVAQALLRPKDISLAAFAAQHGRCSATFYNLFHRAERALRPGTPGPKRGQAEVERLRQRVHQVEGDLRDARARNDDLATQLRGAVVLDPQRLQALTAVMAVHNVTFRGMREVLSVAFGPAVAPSVGHLHALVATLGKCAQARLRTARESLRDRVECLAGDDVFLGGCAVKVLSEPRSNAVLAVGSWRWRQAEDWALWLEEFKVLRLFISDLGTDLVGAVDARELPHIIDFWHEMDWWREHLFEPLAKAELQHQRARDKLRARQRRCEGEALRLLRNEAAREETARARAEREFYLGCEAEGLLRETYAPLRPCGSPWTEATVQATLAALDATLQRISHVAASKVQDHVARNAHRYGTHRVLFESLSVKVKAGSEWTREEVLQTLAQARALHRRADDMRLAVGDQLAADRQARHLDALLARHCLDVSSLRRAWEDLVDWPRRSSSGTESFNNRLRVLQVVQRSVSDPRIALHALAFNLTPREQGRRKGVSPYAQLGVDLGQANRPWYELLRDAA